MKFRDNIIYRLSLLIAFLFLGYFASQYQPPANHNRVMSAEQAFESGLSDVQIEVEATIIRILPDDNKGRRHQRFIIKTEQGLTLLVAHNIDLADRIENLALNQSVRLFGEYEWNKKGGVVHWTHHDPSGRHPDGWIDYLGRRYQ